MMRWSCSSMVRSFEPWYKIKLDIWVVDSATNLKTNNVNVRAKLAQFCLIVNAQFMLCCITSEYSYITGKCACVQKLWGWKVWICEKVHTCQIGCRVITSERNAYVANSNDEEILHQELELIWSLRDYFMGGKQLPWPGFIQPLWLRPLIDF